MDGILGKVRFKQWDCLVLLRHYGNGRPAIQLVDEEDMGPVATATVNVPHFALTDDEVVVKDYSKNEGMLATLLNAGLVVDTGRIVALSEWVSAHICRLVKQEVAS